MYVDVVALKTKSQLLAPHFKLTIDPWTAFQWWVKSSGIRVKSYRSYRGFIRSRDLGTRTRLRWAQYLPLLKGGLKIKRQTTYKGGRLLYHKVPSTLKLNETPKVQVK